ncbi:STAS domain-containing protein [Allosalinactinospora lopnorensis]|uniref:STAS domain-containing protein n=1 Tax=Allosalinactinospora lopnorensis TaxID=1352348 RepID=UPI0009E23274|nr:STAS domain-containing protein [Allosalinactinospora lopnorensis]
MSTVSGDQSRGCTSTTQAASTAYVGTGAGGERGLVYVSGELDLATADRVAAELARAIAAAGPGITVDLSGVTFCDARGLAALVKAANHAGDGGGAIALQGLPPALVRLLRITGLERRFSTVRPGAAEREAYVGDLHSPDPARREERVVVPEARGSGPGRSTAQKEGEHGGDAGERADDEGRRQRFSGRRSSGHRTAAA